MVVTALRQWNVLNASEVPGDSVVKNPSASAGAWRSIPGWGRSPGERMATHSSILAWKIPWMEKLGELQSTGSQRVGYD